MTENRAKRIPANKTAKPLSMLVVDDDPSSRDLLGAILRRKFNVTVHVAHDGPEAMLKCRELTLDIVWLDIDMPGKDGLETLEVILRNNAEQFVVMVSAHGTMDYVRKAISNGARGFIVKPYTMSKVQDAVHHYLDGGHGA